MNWSLSPYPYYHLVGVIIILIAAIFTWSRRQAHVARSLFYVLAAIWFYSFFAMLESAAVAIPTKIILSKLEYIGSTLSIPLMVSFSMQFVRPTLRPARWFIPLLTIIGLLFIVLVWSNELHRLIWMDVVPGPPGTNSAVYVHGPLFYAFMAYIYLSVAGSGVLISRILFTLPRQYRSQAWIILLAVALPLLVMFLYVLELNPPGLDISPISFSLGGIVITLGIVRYGLFDLLPMARHTVIDAMKDGVIILDRQQRVVDFNPSAVGLLKLDPRMTGRPAREILAQFPELLEQFATIKESPVEIRPTEAKPNWLEVRVLPMKSNTGYELGRLVLLRDISIRRSVEDQLRNANRQLLAQLDQIQSLQSMLQEQAVRDPLTGLFNRRYLEETLGREVARAERENYPISLILIDLDGFKGVNDSHGHLAGDAVLHGLGEMLLHNVRRGDIPCRLGGEEFLIIMPNAPAQIGFRRAEELRVRFSQNPVQFDGKALPATFSAGVASFPDHAPNTELLLRAADTAMYAAKQQGRNCVRLAG